MWGFFFTFLLVLFPPCFSLKTRRLTTVVAMKNSGLAVTRGGIEWNRISLKSSFPRELTRFGSFLQRSHSQSLPLMEIRVRAVKALSRAFGGKKIQQQLSNVVGLPNAVMPVGPTRGWTKYWKGKLGEQDAYRGFWILILHIHGNLEGHAHVRSYAYAQVRTEQVLITYLWLTLRYSTNRK